MRGGCFSLSARHAHPVRSDVATPKSGKCHGPEVFCAPLLLRRDFYIHARRENAFWPRRACGDDFFANDTLAISSSRKIRALCGFCARMRPTGAKEMDATPLRALNFTQNPSRQSVFAPALGLKLRRTKNYCQYPPARLCNFGGNSFLTRLIFTDPGLF